MKKVLLTLLGIIVVIGVLAGAGFAGYRLGYNQGANGDTSLLIPRQGFGMPMHNFGKDFGSQGMPMHNFNQGNDRDFGRGGFGMMDRGMGFGFFSPFHFLVRIAFWGLVIWLVYKLIKGSGWHLSLTRQTAESPKVEMPTSDGQAPNTDK